MRGWCQSVAWAGACLFGVLLMHANAQQTNPEAFPRLTWVTNSAEPQRFVGVHGREAAIFGYPRTGLEAWAYPMQLFSGYRIGFQEAGRTSEIRGRDILRLILYRPTEVVRVYVGSDFVVRETLFVPLHKPGLMVNYEVEGRGDISICVHFDPSLNLMWPGALGGQNIEWSDAASGYVEREPLYGYSAMIASPQAIEHEEIGNPAIQFRHGVTMVLKPRPVTGGVKDAQLFSGLDMTHEAASTTVRELEKDNARFHAEARQHVRKLLQKSLQIVTPDREVNRSLAWAELALDQAWVCNPSLGCGEVAGYGPSRPDRRPQYDWFFAGDGLIAMQGMLSAGDYGRARDELDFIRKYQNPSNGMIWHELSQSAGLIDWKHKYPYMYVHVDTTFQYLASVADYVATTGDHVFVTANWKSIDTAYLYCRSLINAKSHLPQIPAGKEGQNEQMRMRDDIGLSSEWISAAEGFAKLATIAGHTKQARRAKEAANEARKAIALDGWDVAHHYWLQGHTIAGRPVFHERSRPSKILLQGVFSRRQVNEALSQLASPEFQADWGTRSLSTNSSTYNPDSYAAGSVTAAGSAAVANTFWKEHRPVTAWQIWHALLAWSTLDSEGHLHEVLAGNYFHPEVQSVPEQTWSSAEYLSSAVHGVLGVKVRAAKHELVFAPRLPAAWQNVSIAHLHVGKSVLKLEVHRDSAEMELRIENDGPPVHVEFEPEVPLGARVSKVSVNGQVRPVAKESYPQEEDVQVSFPAAHGVTQCSIRYRGGVEIEPQMKQPLIGSKSRNIKVIRAELEKHELVLVAYVASEGDDGLLLKTSWRPEVETGAKIEKVAPGLYRLRFLLPAGVSDSYGSYRKVSAMVRFVSNGK